MRCRRCHYENRIEAIFCSGCGEILECICQHCCHPTPKTAKFCDNCGTQCEHPSTLSSNDDSKSQPLSSDSLFIESSSAPTENATTEQVVIPGEAQRRQLTIMFCDLVGSTSISEKLDPEDFRDVLAEFQKECRTIIVRYGGQIARYIGDGLLIYFGYPTTYEDAAYRAVHAAMEIVVSIQTLDKKFSSLNIKLAIRIGINTGKVVVGDIGTGKTRDSMAVVGDVPNIAARLQAIAQPNTIVIGSSTQRLVDGMFKFDALGQQFVKGLSEPVLAYKIIGENTTTNQFESKAKAKQTQLVGREAEINLLFERWKQVEDGDGQVLLLSGEAGIGKSRILKRFSNQLKGHKHWRYFYYCSTHHQTSAFYPVIAQIYHSLGLDFSDKNETKLLKLQARLESLHLRAHEQLPLYAFLLDIEIEKKTYPVLFNNPQQLKQNVIEILIDHFCEMAAQAPILMIVEDIHWLDPSTIELLSLWIEQLQSKRCLLIMTFRPDFPPPWRHHLYFTSLTLNKLSRKESANIISDITSGKSLPTQLLDDIIAKTDGVPLFLEELTKMVLESGELDIVNNTYVLQDSIPSLAIPESLQDSLMARLDQLPEVKEVAQLAATFGRRFSHRLLLAASGIDEQELNQAIEKLLQAELIFKRGTGPDYSYEFKHTMVQEIAYQTLLKSTRQRYHLRIADLLENQFSEKIESNPELLAHHFSEAQSADKAAKHWFRAGQKAVSRSANLEAIDHLSKGLNMLALLPDNTSRAKRELELQITLAVPLTSVKGYASPEVEQTYTRARELCLQIGDTPQLFPSIYGMWRFYLLRAEYVTAGELSKQLLDIAEKMDDPVFSAAAPRSMGATLFYQGKFSDACTNLENVMNLYARDEHRLRALRFDVVDAEVVSHSYYAWARWLEGFPDQAREHSERAISIAYNINHQFSIALATSFASWTYQFCGQKNRTCEIANSALKLSQKYGFQFWVGWAKIMKAWSMSSSKQNIDDCACMQQGLKEWRATGSELGQTFFLVLLANALAKAKKYDQALSILDEALAFAKHTGEKFWLAEIHRTKGELLVLSPSSKNDYAEYRFKMSLDIARKQQCKSLELRSAMSLYQLHQTHTDEKKLAKSHAILDMIYNSFREGFDTYDLRKAKILLNDCR